MSMPIADRRARNAELARRQHEITASITAEERAAAIMRYASPWVQRARDGTLPVKDYSGSAR